MDDHTERLARTEATVDAIQTLLGLIQQEQVRSRESQDRQRDHVDLRFSEMQLNMDRRFSEMQLNMDRRFAEMQLNMDRRFAEQRDYTERGFSEIRSSIDMMRQEQAKMMRWLTGLTITMGFTITGMIVGTLAKVSGLL